MKWRALFFTLCVACLFLCQGCSHSRVFYEKVAVMTPADYNAMKIIKQLEKENVQVTFLPKESKDSLGTVKVTIAASDIFNDNSANFNSKALVVLNKVVILLSYYEEDVVRIKGGINMNYLNGFRSDKKFIDALVLERAHKISQYLWEQSNSASFVYAINNSLPKDTLTIIFEKFCKE